MLRATLASLFALLLSLPALADPLWSGFYIGAHAGYAWGEASTSDDIKDWCSPGDTACINKYVGPFPSMSMVGSGRNRRCQLAARASCDRARGRLGLHGPHRLAPHRFLQSNQVSDA